MNFVSVQYFGTSAVIPRKLWGKSMSYDDSGHRFHKPGPSIGWRTIRNFKQAEYTLRFIALIPGLLIRYQVDLQIAVAAAIFLLSPRDATGSSNSSNFSSIDK